ncbi:MAG: S49 family peptidase [Fuerstiella sp.]
MKDKTFHSFFSNPLAMHQPLWPEIYRLSCSDQPQESESSEAEGSDKTLYNDSPADDFIVSEAVAVVPIHGVMTKRGYWWSSRLSTDRLTDIVKQLTQRSDVEHIVLDIDSGGGQVHGTAQLGNAIFAARETKNVIACVNEFCASAALWVATAADHIVVPATGTIGSLGVYKIHADWSKYLQDVGIKETVIHAGKYKAIHERALTKELKDHEQSYINQMYSAFVDEVARYRGVESEFVLENWADARVFLGSEAVSNGLADELGTLSDVLESLAAGRSGRISLPAPESDQESDDNMPITVNSETGAIMDGEKQIGTLAELSLSAADLEKFCGPSVKAITDAASATAVEAASAEAGDTAKAEFFGQIDQLATDFADAGLSSIAPVVKGEKDVATFRAEQAEAKAAELAAENEALRKGKKAPGFSASDGNGDQGKGDDGPAGDDSNTDLKAAYEKDSEGFACVEDYIAFQTAHAKGLC